MGESMKLTHWQYLAATKQLETAKTCTPDKQVYGGRCLNCGHDPNKEYAISFIVESATSHARGV
jgi:hypothetical protein